MVGFSGTLLLRHGNTYDPLPYGRRREYKPCEGIDPDGFMSVENFLSQTMNRKLRATQEDLDCMEGKLYAKKSLGNAQNATILQ